MQNIEGYDRKAARERRESLVDQTNRRPNLDKGSRNNTGMCNHNIRTVTQLTCFKGLGDIVLGPPRTSFASASSNRSAKSGDASERTPRDSESRDKYGFRKGDGENSRDNGRFNLRSRRPDGDNDNEGWSTVKPRKSFGAEGAERFTGRMGGDRNRDDAPPMPRRGSKDARDDIRGPRGFDNYSRDKDVIRESVEESDGTSRRNGYGRGRNEPSWFKDKEDSAPPPESRKSNGERFGDRNRGWREKIDRDEKNADRPEGRNDRNDRGGDREDRTRGRWDRDDRRQEREPEWLAGEESGGQEKRAHTAAEFQKWKESMNAGIMKTPANEDAPAKTPGIDLSGQNSFFGFDKPKVETPAAIGGDKFKSMFAADYNDTPLIKDEGMKTANISKASRFTSFFATPQPDDSPRRQNEPAPRPPPGIQEPNPQVDKEQDDFSRLLMKLQSQSIAGTGAKTPTPPMNQSMQPKPPAPTQKPMNIQLPPLEQFQQYGRQGYQPEPPRSGTQSSHGPTIHGLLDSRASSMSQPSSRPDTLVQELMNQRENTMSQGSRRPEPQVLNKEQQFLMGLMNAPRPTPEQMRAEQHNMMRGPPQQPPPNRTHQMMMEREELMMRERREREAAQRQRQEQGPPPLNFFDDGFLGRGPMSAGPEGRDQQPTQILQRPPPGLDQMREQLPHWAQQQQLPPPMSQRHPIGAPPGLQNGPGGPGPQRGMPMPPPMGFPPGFMPPMGPPPMGFPPGFMPPPNMGGFPGPNGPLPEGMGFSPYDGRGAPPQQGGPFRR